MRNLKMKTDNFILDNFTKVGLFISGGLDSSLMLYLITKEIKEKNSNVEFITYTVEQHTKKTKQHVDDIIKIVEELKKLGVETIEKVIAGGEQAEDIINNVISQIE